MSCKTPGMFQMENLSVLPPAMGMGKLSRLKTQTLFVGPRRFLCDVIDSPAQTFLDIFLAFKLRKKKDTKLGVHGGC